MCELENCFLSYLYRDVSIFSALDRLKKAGLLKKAGK